MRRWTATLVGLLLGTAILIPASPAAAYTTKFYNGAGAAVPRIGVIGDSSASGIRWVNTYGPLKRFNFVFDAESCRRTIAASCRGREGYRPLNALDTLKRLSGRWGKVLVMVTGYNDPGREFAGAVDAIMREAIRQRIPKVIWLTMRTADVSYVAPTFLSNAYTFRDNNRILLQKATQYGGRLQIADWATYTKYKPSWFAADGVHYRSGGAWGAADYIAQQAERVLAGQRITPSSTGGSGVPVWTTLQPGDRGTLVEMLQNALYRLHYSVTASGYYGSTTTYAVRLFQSRKGLPVTGVVDARTARAMGLYTGGGTIIVPPPPPPPGATGTYRVVAGDGLYAIARKTNTPLATLLSLNNLTLSSVIYPGQILRIRPAT